MEEQDNPSSVKKWDMTEADERECIAISAFGIMKYSSLSTGFQTGRGLRPSLDHVKIRDEVKRESPPQLMFVIMRRKGGEQLSRDLLT